VGSEVLCYEVGNAESPVFVLGGDNDDDDDDDVSTRRRTSSSGREVDAAAVAVEHT